MSILLAACAAHVLVNVVQIGYRWNGLLRFKPFTCETCMTGWCALPLLLFHQVPWLYVPYGMCAAMVASIVFNLLIGKL